MNGLCPLAGRAGAHPCGCLIERIDGAPDGISLALHTAGNRSLVAELAEQEPPVPAESEPLLEAAE